MMRFFRARKRPKGGPSDFAFEESSSVSRLNLEPHQDLPTDARRHSQLASVKKQNAHATLLDAMRAVSGKSQTPSIVVAGIARANSSLAVLQGVADQAALRGVRLKIGDVIVTQTHRTLSIRDDPATPAGPTTIDDESLGTSLSLELTAQAAQEALKNWFVTAGTGCDLLIVAAPPILGSVDALLVARACDGLVLVAEPLATQREEFEIAVERARASGCQVLGLVMNENREWLPRFLSRLFSSYPRSIEVSPSPAE